MSGRAHRKRRRWLCDENSRRSTGSFLTTCSSLTGKTCASQSVHTVRPARSRCTASASELRRAGKLFHQGLWTARLRGFEKPLVDNWHQQEARDKWLTKVSKIGRASCRERV